ncbi:DUF402 domain-containing protein [Paenibacillus aurantius]|uniref:DUF402 domain-containing protein n=1 Tax=Paenibacillus aurantius TaxID=2918900 RepID=A0AA96RJ25_9BACL|nr:DUF402 domain-containing protein [Paenibacillus aurantius]WNQ12794.1 DUF402 domain-containing protein [Paenibacillus aurantius]
MLKRKYGHRPGWSRVLEREYAQEYVDTDDFRGHLSLLRLRQTASPLLARYGERTVCIADSGYEWLQQFPEDAHHSVTVMFDARGMIVQWYVDICLRNGWDGRNPWMDDLFLDLIVLPEGEVIVKDAGELEQALADGVVNRELYELAWNECRRLKELSEQGRFPLLSLAAKHRERLLPELEPG